MINKLLFDIKKKIDLSEKENDSNKDDEIIVCLKKIDKTGNCNFLSKADTNTLSCINIGCEFKKYLMIFYPKIDLFLLPAFNENFFCIVCDMVHTKKLTRSEIKISDKFVVQFTNFTQKI